MIKKNHFILKEKTALASIFLILFSFFFLVYQSLLNAKFSDIYAHFIHSINISKGYSLYPPNFFLYLITNIGTDFFQKKYIFISVIALSLYLKFLVTYFIIKKEIKTGDLYLNILTSLSLLFVFSLPTLMIIKKQLYLGSFVPTVWHNTTTIVLMPFAILLYYYIFNTTYSKKNTLIIFTLIIINIIIKPSFLFVLIGLLFFNSLISYITNKKITVEIKTHLLYTVIITFLITLQYILIYNVNMGSIQSEKSSIDVCLFKFYKIISFKKNIPIAFLAGYLFPLITLMNKKSTTYKNYTNAWALTILALIILFVFTENGPRASHGNFYWQIIPSSYLLFLFSTVLVLKYWQTISYKKKYTYTFIYFLHFIFGIVYFCKVIFFNEMT